MNGLTAAIASQVTSSGGGITSGSLSNNGYVKFKNGLIVQWGRSDYMDKWTTDSSLRNMTLAQNVIFGIDFSQSCYTVSLTPNCSEITGDARSFVTQLDNYNCTGFSYRLYGIGTDFHSCNFTGNFFVDYIAIGK